MEGGQVFKETAVLRGGRWGEVGGGGGRWGEVGGGGGRWGEVGGGEVLRDNLVDNVNLPK